MKRWGIFIFALASHLITHIIHISIFSPPYHMFFVKIFYALLGIGMGLGILKYRKVVYGWTGRWYWAEKYLGSGGTIFVISLI